MEAILSWPQCVNVNMDVIIHPCPNLYADLINGLQKEAPEYE